MVGVFPHLAPGRWLAMALELVQTSTQRFTAQQSIAQMVLGGRLPDRQLRRSPARWGTAALQQHICTASYLLTCRTHSPGDER